jgi:hypothetical protein
MGICPSKTIQIPVNNIIRVVDLIRINNNVKNGKMSGDEKYKWLCFLDEIPLYVNYTIRKPINNPNDIGTIIDINDSFISSTTPLSKHILPRDVSYDCIIILSNEQYKIYIKYKNYAG